MTKLGIVAGESSGDQLGAQLIQSLRRINPAIEIYGMCGPKMRAAGCIPLADIEELSVMGLVEVLRKYPSLRRLRSRLTRDLLALNLDAFVGIDVPDFVHYIEERLKSSGVKTVHYVAPQVWAWRPKRAKNLVKALDLLLVLFPFEPAFFSRYGIDTRFVGHPLVQHIPDPVDRDASVRRLGLDPAQKYIALMPGSRRQELKRHTALFCETAVKISRLYPDYDFLVGAIHDAAKDFIEQTLKTYEFGDKVKIVVGQSHDVLIASDAALVVSGTVTMEALAAKTPMVVAIRIARLSYQILKHLVKTPYVAMPNVLADEPIVPEFVQDQASVDNLAEALSGWLSNREKRDAFYERASALRMSLDVTSKDAAAAAIQQLIGVREK